MNNICMYDLDRLLCELGVPYNLRGRDVIITILSNYTVEDLRNKITCVYMDAGGASGERHLRYILKQKIDRNASTYKKIFGACENVTLKGFLIGLRLHIDKEGRVDRDDG